MADNAPMVLCILPAFNETGKIGRVVTAVRDSGQVDTVVVVDDASTDGTSDEARAAGGEVIRHRMNRGVGAAIRSGLQYGRQHGYAVAVIMSGDDQHEAGELAGVLAPLREGRADFVQGSRRLPGGKTVDGPLFREVTTRLFSIAFTVLSGRKITDGTNGFRAFFLSILDDPGINLDQEWLDRYELEVYLLYKAVRSPRIRVVEAPVTVYYRGGTRQYSKMKPFRDWWRLVRPLIFLKLRWRR
jgi:dolichol-phosphate mannosyltransferase